MGGREQISEFRVGVLIIGAGAAGLRAAIELRTRGVDCLVMGKRPHGDAHTRWAAGGINAAFGHLDPEDRWEIHAADTIREGHFVCQPRAVELLAREAPERLLELWKWGCDFNLTPDGKINQRYFGAQSFRRTCFVGDMTGEAILRTLVDRAGKVGTPYRQNVFVLRLLAEGGVVKGALAMDMESGEPLVFAAKRVLLAAGGCTSVYSRSSSRPDENTGDGLALAYEAGAALRDMEFIQFHPTGMVQPEGMKGRLVTEAVRGEGGVLRNRLGERFMERYSPEKMELDARDVVARANYQEIHAGRGTEAGGVYLDISHQKPDFIRERLPKIHRQFLDQGIDISRQPMEVAPTAHYPMGGVAVDFDTGATTVPGLHAVGEVTAGLHGANRLGGNSLAETVVFGRKVGEHLAETLGEGPGKPVGLPRTLVSDAMGVFDLREKGGRGFGPERFIREARELMGTHAGIVRSGEGLREGLEKWMELGERAKSESVSKGLGGASFESAANLWFMLTAGEAVFRAAEMREESRGAHWRDDFPGSREIWRKNVLAARRGDGAMKLWSEPVPGIARKIQAAIAEHHQLDYHHLE